MSVGVDSTWLIPFRTNIAVVMQCFMATNKFTEKYKCSKFVE